MEAEKCNRLFGNN